MGKKLGGKAGRPKNWIKNAIKQPGALRQSLGARPGMPLSSTRVEEAESAPGKLGQRARLAMTLKKLRKAKGKK